MTALAHERPDTMSETQAEFLNGPDLDEVLWQVWKTAELPEGYRAEIIEGALEVSPTGRRSHGLIANRVRRALDRFLNGGEYACHQDVNVIHKRREYARAGIPVYVLIDDYDGQAAVTLFIGPRPDKADWEDIHRVPYGTDVTLPADGCE